MRVYSLIILLSFNWSIINAQDDILETRISISFSNVQLLEVLSLLKTEIDIQFAYNSANSAFSNEVSGQFIDVPLKEILSELLDDNNLDFQFIGGKVTIYYKTQSLFLQNLRGVIFDTHTKLPLIGATVRVISDSEIPIGGITNLDGEFDIAGLPVGRYGLQISFVGYQSRSTNILLKTGKEAFIEVGLDESIGKLDELVVTAEHRKDIPINQMAMVSARAFSIDEASRFAGSFDDPARMALAYAGVQGGGDDIRNEIIVRGNSPKGLLWRLEGVEIPNPNHFNDGMPAGGAVSLLSSNVLTNSDFFTGAFPAEYGNALSGVFDIKFRKGNNKKREYAVQLGVLGAEVSAEGPFKTNYNGSYLINYRYSTLALIGSLFDSQNSRYQDLSFNVTLPTKRAGNFNLFGLAGNSSEKEDEVFAFPPIGSYQPAESRGGLSVFGLKNFLPLGKSSYLKSVIVLSHSLNNEINKNIAIIGDPNNQNVLPELRLIEDKNRSTNSSIRAVVEFNQKISPGFNFNIGFINGLIDYRLRSYTKDGLSNTLGSELDQSGSTLISQGYFGWKHQATRSFEWTAGLHSSYLTLNDSWSVEPRVGLRWLISNRMSLTGGYGVHSRMESLGLYLAEIEENGSIILPNKQLGFTKADHYVVGYNLGIGENTHFLIEAYWQKLYYVPTDSSNNSSINFQGSEIIDSRMYPTGKGYNKGIDVTLEKYFHRGYFYLATFSLYESTFSANGKKFSTRYNNQFNSSFLIGKEFTLGRYANKTLGISSKYIRNGGRPITPILVGESQTSESIVEDPAMIYQDRSNDYFRIDLQINFKINKEKTTHTWKVDVQNITNRMNQLERYYDGSSESIKWRLQNGILPIISYKLEF